MAKKVILGPKPQPNRPANADEWVNGSSPSGDPTSHGVAHENTSVSETTTGTAHGTVSSMGLETAPDSPTMKRLTIDVPESLHAQIKSRCALKGVKMADEIRGLLETHFLASDRAA